MDNLEHDALDPIEAVKSLGSTAKNAARSIRNKAKAKEAQKAADAGQYFTLAPFNKGLISIPGYVLDMVKDKHISEYAILQLPAQGTNSSNTQIIAALQKMSNDPVIPGSAYAELRTNWIESMTNTDTDSGISYKSSNPGGTVTTNSADLTTKVKSSLPYIIVGILVIVLIYFIYKKH